MGNIYISSFNPEDSLTREDLLINLLEVLHSDRYERGEGVEEVLSITDQYRKLLTDRLSPEDTEGYQCILWNLDSLHQEANNMLHNPNHDLFLYLKAYHTLRDNLQNMFPSCQMIAM
ncbi:hypothetical protein [Rufibacter immobilis]|uniref:hypothetical protein n=1 Tax=Rufibacter immobilis TaxID=1348778 RepID=UPI0011CEB500|nr:hypothetical protein [Rufibacter immobilis]